MADSETQSQVLHLFAQMLEYPRPGLAAAAAECRDLVSSTTPEAVALLSVFHAFAEEAPPGQLEEFYTSAFDLDATCYPYAGFHLFGESYKRSIFMIGLKERYRDCNFVMPGNDLPDHVAVILRFLSVCKNAAIAEEILQDALLPTLKRMAGKNKDEAPSEDDSEPESGGRRSIYQPVLKALVFYLESGTPGRGNLEMRAGTLTD